MEAVGHQFDLEEDQHPPGGHVGHAEDGAVDFNKQENLDNGVIKYEDNKSLQNENDNENNIDEFEERRNCAGFEENLVLAVKECFFEDEIRCILIKKTKNGRKVKYFSRTCSNYVAGKRKVCEACDQWFTCLSAGIPFSESEAKSTCNSSDKTSGSVNKSGDTQNFTIKKEEKTKTEVDDDDWVPGKPLDQDLDEEEGTVEGEEREVEKRRPGRRKGAAKEKADEYRVQGGWVCKIPDCGKVISLRKAWVKHVRSHSGKTKCKLCGTVVTKLEEHVKRRHPQDAHKGMQFFSDGEIRKERKPYTRTKPLVAEKQEAEANYDDDRDELGNFICRYQNCNKVFDAKKSYLKHIFLTHEGGAGNAKRKKICDICGNLITANNMKQHVRTVHTHKNEKNFACEHCGKEFKYRSELTIHLTLHTGEMNFACSGCAKRFRRAAEARLCEKGHRGIFSFRCHMCDYKTNKKNHLDRHIESHLKATPFICPICGFKSGRKDNLKQHIDKRHCSATTSIKQLEEMYPDMYKMHETNEAATIAKTEALAENFARMHENEDGTMESSSSAGAHQNSSSMKPGHEMTGVLQVDRKPGADNKWGAKFLPPSGHFSEQHSKYLQQNELGSVNNGENCILPQEVSESLNYGLDDQQSVDEVEHKYLPPPPPHQQSNLHSQAGGQSGELLGQSGDMVPGAGRSGGDLVTGGAGQSLPGGGQAPIRSLESDRYIQDDEDRAPSNSGMQHDQRDRLSQDSRDGGSRYLQVQDRNKLILEDRDRVLAEQRRRDYRDTLILDRQRERLLVEQRERDRLAALEMLQEHRERLSQQQNSGATPPSGHPGSTTSLAEMYQRMRSLE